MIYLSGRYVEGRPLMASPNGPNKLPVEGQLWAADNGRYAAPEKYTDDRYLAWLQRRRRVQARLPVRDDARRGRRLARRWS